MSSAKAARGTGNSGRERARRELAAKRAVAAARRRVLVVAGSVVAVLAVVATLVIVKIATGSGGPTSGQQAGAAPAAVTDKLENVPSSTFDQVGAGALTSAPKAGSGAALTAGGMPRILYVGAEYCPFCATERWPLAVALARFGTFSGLGEVRSAPAPEVYPDTATLTFYKSSYRSTHVAFTAVETESNQVVDGQYAPLQSPSAADAAVLRANDPQGSIPFIDVGGRWVFLGASYDPQVLQGKSQLQISAALADPSSPIARGVDGAANVIAAAICQATAQTPAAVCTSAGVRTAAAGLGHGAS